MRSPKKHPREGTIYSGDIILAYKEAFRMSWWQSFLSLFGTFKMADAYYHEADESVIKEVLAKDLTDRKEYITETFDCDDFAFQLMGVFHKHETACAYPIFITWVEWYEDNQRYGHAVLSYFIGGMVKIIEPQNDSVFSVPEGWSLNLLCG